MDYNSPRDEIRALIKEFGYDKFKEICLEMFGEEFVKHAVGDGGKK